MSTGLKRIVVALVFFSGCLKEGPAPKGRLLFHGQHLESPSFLTVGFGNDTLVRFEDRISYATPTQGGVSDVWVSSFDGSVQRKIVSRRSDFWGEQPISWPLPDPQHPHVGERYFMVDENLVPSNGGLARVATLVRLGAALDEEFRLEQISSYARFSISIRGLFENPGNGRSCPGFPKLADDCPQLFYERPVAPGERYPTLMLWDGTNHVPIGADSGSFQLQTVGNNAYFILEDQRRLTRFRRPAYALESLRDNVSRFSVSGDERYVALTVTDAGTTKTIVRDLATGKEVAPARPNPSAWARPDRGLFGPHEFYYMQNKTASGPAEAHTLDLVTGVDTVELLPVDLANWSGTLKRNDDERLLLDSSGRGVFTGNNDFIARRSVAGPLYTPSFSPDGKYLLYILPAAPTLFDTTMQGPLLFQDADQTDLPPTMVSPPGLLVNARNGASYFFTENGTVLVFWAHLGRSSSDLYFADNVDGSLPTNLRLIAKSILSVSISARTLFGVLNMSQQDGVGDLVYRDIASGAETLYAQSVLEAAQHAGPDLPSSYTAYIIRARTDSDRSGLWISPMIPPPIPDGGRD